MHEYLYMELHPFLGTAPAYTRALATIELGTKKKILATTCIWEHDGERKTTTSLTRHPKSDSNAYVEEKANWTDRRSQSVTPVAIGWATWVLILRMSPENTNEFMDSCRE